MKICIIGAGIGGLGAGALLAKDGHEVTIYEKNNTVGGRCNIIEEDGYIFDTGPSWYLMPDVFDKFFKEFDKSADDLMDLIHLDPQYRIITDSGEKIDITGNLEIDLVTFEKIEPGSAEMFKKYLDKSKEKYEISMNHILYNNYDSILDFVKDPNIRSSGRKLAAFSSMDSYVNKYFKSELMRQIVQYSLVFLGGSPKKTPALYSLMTHIDYNLGVWYPRGGMYELIKAIENIGKENGAVIKKGSSIESIVTKKGKATGVIINREEVNYDIVISNADYHHTERLLDDKSLISYDDKYWESKTQAPSAFLMFLGVKGELPDLIHHNIFFGENWIDHFNEIFENPQWPQKPSIYISKTSHTDDSVSPEGHENLVILTPIPVGIDDSDESREKYRNFLLNYLKESISLDLEERIVYERLFSINDFANDFNSYKGTALGLAHTLTQSAIWRPSNKSKNVENLFFVGGNTTPGIGVPICLISSSLVRDRIADYTINS